MRIPRLHPALVALINALITIVIVIVAWQIIVSLVSPYVAKGPLQVWNYLFVTKDGVTDPAKTAEGHRSALGQLLGVTLGDAALGFATGMVIAIVLAIVFTLSRTVEASIMPLALFLRTVPLVALAPVVILITGTGTPASVAVLSAIVVLFPALAAVMFGLSRASQQSLDLVSVYGGSRWTQMRKVLLPGALPSLFAAARVSVPGAITGALLAEWLSTGKGIGYALQTFPPSAKFDDLWAAVAVVTFITLIAYNLVAIVERLVLQSMHMVQASDR